MQIKGIQSKIIIVKFIQKNKHIQRTIPETATADAFLSASPALVAAAAAAAAATEIGFIAG